MTCNVGEALLWEGYLLNLSSNCECQREALPAPRLEQSIEEPPGGCAIEHGPTLSLLPWGGNLHGHAFPSSRETWGRIAWAFCGPLLVSSTGDAGCTENVSRMSQCRLM